MQTIRNDFHISCLTFCVCLLTVIDSGRERELRRNKRTSTSVLVSDWCSKASTKQRAGRAGRVKPGLCLKLFSSRKFETFKTSSEPELKRVPLEEVCLSILASGIGTDCSEFLSKAPQSPDSSAIQSALDILAEVGAILVKSQMACSCSSETGLLSQPL